MTSFTIRTGSWDELQNDAKLIREQVFIQEQNIPVAEEWDAQDAVSLHFVVYDQDQPIATARLLQNNSIGRVAVLKSYRGQGIGKLLMLQIIPRAKNEQRKFLKLSSQVHAIQFYAALGFTVQGEEYLDCGIPHIDMYLKLD
ncbi:MULTISPECIES: GNAT family N-acetyltransferase [unclassified Acinetobacter]|jgi:predicted GNAT family N-acyltransferase|uniref:GNAT family N-acetyltransferase n=1 Tax=unclassified Acinetobacter TaxID=196816 RepID=UPI000A35397A|nr:MULTISPECIES: GNAT family N-acetyltransferase [unclassified Acinetobacter]MDN5511216.1 GNAT family N-acetyltransferase [Acinetobacter sp.]MDN5524110.1 GNAT family N-acetyltransferase [Acinetobacter sp.]OTG62317.1 GNAT family N-acetyltransferase [Acinetobacter sp. ANC 3903]